MGGLKYALTMLILVIVVLAIMVVVTISKSEAMDWYEPACCSNHDCEQIDDTAVTMESGGYHVRYHARLGFNVDAIVPFGEARPSRDEYYHGCANTDRFLCLYVPANT